MDVVTKPINNLFLQFSRDQHTIFPLLEPHLLVRSDHLTFSMLFILVKLACEN